MKKLILLSFLISGLQFFGQTILESYPGSTPSIYQTSNYINLNNKMYYFGRTSGYQWSLYTTDGTTTGNVAVKNLALQIANVIPQDIDARYNDYKVVFDNKLYFTAVGQLWQSDGTSAGTNLFSTAYNAKYFKVFNGKLYFTAQNAANGTEVWSSDGTLAGTTMLKDIYPGTNPSIDQQFDPHFTVFNNKLFFVANDGTNGFELWSTDGTTAGTNLFKNIRITETESNVYNTGAFMRVSVYGIEPFKVYNNKMYFNAIDDVTYPYGNEFRLFETDGTPAGTKNVSISVNYATCGCSPGSPNFFTAKGLTVTTNNDLVMSGSPVFPISTGDTLFGIYKLNTSNYITKIQNTFVYQGDSGSGADTDQFSMKFFNGEYYFISQSTVSGSTIELWKMDPSTFQFTQVSQPATLGYILFNTNNGYSRLLLSKEWNGKLYFSKADSSNGAIFATDGTLAGTTQVTRSSVLNTSPNSTLAVMKTSPTQLNDFVNGLYFGSSFTSGIPASIYRFYDPNLSTQQLSKTKFSMYPNPTSSQINLSFENNLENANLKITSILGQTVLEKQNLSGNDFNINVSNLTKGIYIIELNDGVSVINSKFIKE